MKTTVLTAIPQELINRDQWVLWRLETRNKKQTKIPYQINGLNADSTNFNTWTTYDNAVNALDSGKYSGIGYVLTSDDPYTVIDLDDCIIDGKVKPEAMELIEKLDSYTEYSQSGKGLHIFIRGKKPGNRSKNAEKNIELYDNKRFIVMTGNHVEGTPKGIKDRQVSLDYIYDQYFSVSTENKQQEIGLIKDLKPSPDMDDQEILSIAFNAANGDVIKRLYDGDTSMHNNDHSGADQALCNHLVFYTQKPEQIDRIFRGSKLYRDKWDSKRGNTTYGMITINEAINKLKNTYQKKNDFQSESIIIPEPFKVIDESLYSIKKAKNENENDQTIFVSRHVPILTKEFHNVERPQLLYEITWKQGKRIVKEVVPASTVATSV